jgi:predicted aminopeptidase
VAGPSAASRRPRSRRAGVCLTSGCSTVGYYARSVTGHLELLQAARPVPQWLDDPATSARLKERLELSQRIRDFAVSALGEPDNASYRRYADLHRAAAVWNVVAAPELSLVPKTWCFAVVGCVGYRGYYAQADADALAAELKKEGLDVGVYPVPAYSTLGRLPAGGFFADPLLSTFIGYPEGELARLVFHELAHQVVFVPGDTAFNESFASTVEKIGEARWLAEHAGPEARAAADAAQARRADFRAITTRFRDELARVYASAASDDEKRAGKAAVLARLRAEYATLKTTRWGRLCRLRRLVRERQQRRASRCSRATPAWCRRSSASTSARAATSRASTPRCGASPRCPPPSGPTRSRAKLAPFSPTELPWPTSTSTARTASASPARARPRGAGPSSPSRSSAWSAR